jgi:phosphohistidine phosphatase
MTARRTVSILDTIKNRGAESKTKIVTNCGHCAVSGRMYARYMELFILRHGIAVERGTSGYKNDFDRPLTPKGKRQLRQSCGALRKMKLKFDLILSSPLVRARETAEIVATELKSKKRLRFSEHLRPGGSFHKLILDVCQSKPAPENVLLVGHEPDLSELISLLVSGKSHGGFALKKGGLAKLEVEHLRAGQCATLAWLLTPKLLKKL